MRTVSLCLALCAFFTANFAAAVVVEDFNKAKAEDYYAVNQERGQTTRIVSNPAGTGQSIRVDWDADKHKFAELSLPPRLRPQLPEFEEAVFKVDVYAPENSPVTFLGLRLIDARGEVFQWRQGVKFYKSGHNEVSFKVTPGNFSVSWGGNNDKVIDWPVKLLGFGIDYARESGQSHLLLDCVNFSSASGDKLACTIIPADFDDAELWLLNAYNGKGKINQTPSGLELKGQAGEYILRQRKWELVDYKAPRQLILKVKVPSGSAEVALRLKGADNKTVESPPQKVSPGQDEYAFDFTGAALTAPVKLDFIKIRRQSPETDLLFQELRLVYDDYPANAIQVQIDTGNPLPLLSPSDKRPVALNLKNISDRAVSFKLDLVLEDFFGTRINLAESFTLGGGAQQQWRLPVTPVKYGIWWVDYTIIDVNAEDSRSSGRSSFAYMDFAGPTPGMAEQYFFGMCTHTQRWSKRERELEALAAALCGVKMMRTGPTWGSVQPAPDTWNLELMDEIVKMYGDKGIELQYILAYTPRWAAPADKQKSSNWLDWSRAKPDVAAWSQYARKMAQRYDGKIRYWEIWNEPDISFFRGNIDEYLEMMKSAHHELKAVNPDNKVLTGGFASFTHSHTKPNFQRDVLLRGKEFFDIHAFHGHSSFERYARTIDDKLIKLRKETDTKVPWFANETAINSMDGAEKFQAETLYKKFLFAWARGSIGYNWYNLRNDGYDKHDPEHHYGLMTNDFHPKAAYPAYNALAKYFSGMKFDRQLKLDDNLWAFVFYGKDRIIIPAWNEVKTAAGKHLVIKTDAKKAEKIDLMGNAETLPVVDGMTILEISPLPAALNLSAGASRAEIHGSLVEVQPLNAVIPGDTVTCGVKLLNPFDQEKTYELAFICPAGIKAKDEIKHIKVAGGSPAQTKIEFAVDSDIKSAKDGELSIKLLYRLSGTDWNGAFDIPVNLAKLIRTGTTKSAEADFVLKDRAQVISLFEADPNKADLVWKGKDDLSATLKLDADDNNLLISIDVTDDVHRQDHKGADIWRADNIQMALQMPGQAGFWEIGLARLNDGKPEIFIWAAPQGVDAIATTARIKLSTSRQGTLTRYNATIPLAALNITRQTLADGIRFNMLVNDDDGGGREGWIHIAPGLGSGKNPDRFPFIIFR